ncbi:hypothetical protein V2J09_009483 [Rumex salicifolius]
MKASSKPRRANKITNLVLEEIIGLTAKNSNGLASNTTTSYCVYPAGSVAVVYDVVARKQSHLIVKHRAPKPLSCVTVSPDGRFVAAGESGTQPAVLVWDYAGRTCLVELKSHHYGVACVAFSPDGQLLASVGFPRDDSICLWHWSSKILHIRIKACSPYSAILSISFSSNGKFIVTAGNKHINRWNIRCSKQGHSKAKAAPLALHNKPITVNLDSATGISFVSVICTHDSVYAITNTGSLCLLQSDLSVVEVVNLMVEKGFALAASSKLIACACSGGIVKLFDVTDLSHAGNLYYSEPINCQDERNSDSSEGMADKYCEPIPTHPDAVACHDHSLYVWDINDKYKATRCCVLVSHADCILDMKALPCEHMHDPSTACVSRGCSGGVSFATCSADGLIRFWDLVLQPLQLDNAKETHSESHILDVNSVGSTYLVSAGIFERDVIELGSRTQGFRSMAVSSDGKQLAVGDCQGSLYVYDLKTFEYLCLQDKKIKIFKLFAGKLLRTCEQNGDLGEPIKADGDGCIFVWNIPASLGSRMLQKNRENFGLVSPSKIAALSQLKFFEKERQESVTDCSKKVIPGTESPFNQEGKSQFGSNFRFSISRLPTWARSKITILDDTLQVDNVSSSSQTECKNVPHLVVNEVYGTEHSNQYDRDPSTSGSSSDSEGGKDSFVTDKSHNFSTGKGEQWKSIYTVCLDHLSTPDIWGSINKKIPVKRFNIESPIMKMPCDGEEKQIPIGSSDTTKSDLNQSSSQHDIDVIHYGKYIDLNDKKKSISMHEDYYGDDIDHARSHCISIKKSEEQHLEADKEDPCLVPCDDDIFNQHFGNLSSNFKLKGKRSSAKRCYSARFVVKRDHFRGFMKPGDDHGFGTFDSVEKTSSKVVPINFENPWT